MMIKSQMKNLIKSSFKNNTNSKNFLNLNFPHKSNLFFKNNIFKRNFCEKSDKKEEEFISFGYKNVKKEERQGMVNEVFANVASR